MPWHYNGALSGPSVMIDGVEFKINSLFYHLFPIMQFSSALNIQPLLLKDPLPLVCNAV